MSALTGESNPFVCRFLGIALLGAVSLTGAAPAQFGQAAGFGEVMSPYFLRRDLQLIEESLDLDEGQAVILESVFWDYEDEHEAGTERMKDRIESMQEELQALDRPRILQLVFAPFEQRAEEWDNLNTQFLDNVRAILSEEQVEYWPQFRAKLRREKQLPKGHFSGESLDLFHIIREIEIPEQTQMLLGQLLDDYAQRLDEALQRRQMLFRESRMLMIQSIRQEDPEELLRTYKQQIESRVAVRTVNDDYIEIISAALPDEMSETFRSAALERAFSRVFRTTATQRMFDAAAKLPDLSTEILEAILQLESSYEQELAAINADLVRLIRKHEPEEEIHRGRVFAMRNSGQRPDRPEDPTREEFRRRDQVGQRYAEQLRALLTPEQFASLPGAGRMLKKEQMKNPNVTTGRTAGPAKPRGGSPAGIGEQRPGGLKERRSIPGGTGNSNRKGPRGPK